MGDFIDLLKHDQNLKQERLEILSSASFLPLISKPTCVTVHSVSLHDNIFCNTLPIPNYSIILPDISDHNPITYHFNLKVVKKKNHILHRQDAEPPQKIYQVSVPV